MFETPKNFNNIYIHIHIQISDQDNNARVFQPLIVASQDSMQTSAYAQSIIVLMHCQPSHHMRCKPS